MSSKKAYTGYFPRKYQQYLHNNLERFNVLVCHRRFGKTMFALNEMIDQAFRCDKKNPQYAYISPNYAQTKRVAWDPLKQYLGDVPGLDTNEQQLRADVKRPWSKDFIRFLMLGSENPDSIRGIHLDGAIIDEYASCDPTIFTQVVLPALSDRGGWCIFIGTPAGQNHFYDLYEHAGRTDGWFRATFKASDTKIIPEQDLLAAKASMSEEEYEQEFECSFSAPNTGAYYAKYIHKIEHKGQITIDCSYDPDLPVETFWDLGIDDSTAIWFMQQTREGFRFIDYLENSGEGLDWYGQELMKKPYTYREHFLPHDGGNRDYSTGKTRQQSLYEMGLGRVRVVARNENKPEHRIEEVRKVLKECWFHPDKCQRGLDALKNYQRKWDGKNQIWSTRPLHNWASHGADAFGLFAMSRQSWESVERRRSNRNLPQQTTTTGWNPLEI
jgi:hypothetical protein